tara:strand:+ start:1008 stop:1718 length:711 start_codon:yes stop_codon:yes gene_type:complete
MKFLFIKFLEYIGLAFSIIAYGYKVNSTSRVELTLQENLNKKVFETFGEIFKKCLLYKNTSQIREYAIKNALTNDIGKEYYYLELGVWKGHSANFFSRYVKKLYAFDSFEGLSEDWAGSLDSKYSMSLNKKVPKLNSNVEITVGWVEDTLDKFLEKHNPKINFIHLDMDTFSPTKYALEKIKPYLVKGATIIFDELYNYNGWEEGEYKALKEIFKDNEYQFKAFNINSCQVVVQLI